MGRLSDSAQDVQILERMRELVTQGWTQGDFIVSGLGSDAIWIMLADEEELAAASFCLLGAGARAMVEVISPEQLDPGSDFENDEDVADTFVSSTGAGELVLNLVTEHPKNHGLVTIALWNDLEGRTHREVVELIDRALSVARGISAGTVPDRGHA